MLSSMKALTTEGAILEKCVDDLEQIQNLWDKAVTLGIKTLNATKSEQKNNTDIDDGVKFSSIRFSSKDDISESKEIVRITLENLNKIPEVEIFDVSKNVAKGYDIKSKAIAKYFSSIGEQAVNPELGIVELKMSGAKSTVFHGFGEDKLIAVTAIKDVIEKGVIINHSPNYDNKNYDRYIISGFGKIKGENCYVSVVVKNYPHNKKWNNKFYLHEVTKIETDSHIMTSTQESDKLVSESISKNIISSSAEKVNKDTTKFSMRDSEYLEAVKNNDMETAQRLVDEAAEKAFVDSKAL